MAHATAGACSVPDLEACMRTSTRARGQNVAFDQQEKSDRRAAMHTTGLFSDHMNFDGIAHRQTGCMSINNARKKGTPVFLRTTYVWFRS